VVSYADIVVRGSVANVQNLVQTAFAANGFSVKWAGPTRGKAEKGSKGLNIAFGALAQYYGVDFEIYPAQDAATLRLQKSNTGLAGSLVGVALVNKKFNDLADTMASWFQQQGVLQAVQKK
jgi:hypothetical protein